MVLLVFVIHFVGVYIYFVVTLQRIHSEKRAMIRSLPLEKLQRLEFTLVSYEKAKVDEHEVKVNGKMFDIGRIEFQEDKVVVYALQDADEDSLLAFLNKVTTQTSQNNTRAPSQFTQFISLLFVVPPGISVNAPCMSHETSLTKYFFTECSFVAALVTPPPRKS